MYFKVEQISNDFYSDEFSIKDSNEKELGNIKLTGRMGTIDANIQIKYLSDNITLNKKYKNAKEFIKATFGCGIFRPYVIKINEMEKGRIYTKYKNEERFGKIALKELIIDGEKYQSYLWGLGKEGLVYSIYKEDKQIGAIKKSSEIIDGLNIYELKCIEDKYMIPTLLQCLYIHVFSYYRPGEKVMKGKQTKTTITKSELLKSKYNPNFWGEN